MDNRNRKVLSDLLIDVGMITSEQLRSALETQKLTGEKIEEILVREGNLSEKDIIGVLQLQTGIPYVDIDHYDVDPEACLAISEALAKKHTVIPIKKENNILTLVMTDPLNIFAIDDVHIYSGLGVQPVIGETGSINRAIKRYYGTQSAKKAVEEFLTTQGSSLKIASRNDEEDQEALRNAPTVRLVNTIIEQAVRSKASDIHIEPFENDIKIRYRVDGHLKDVMHTDIEIANALITRIKIIGGMNIAEKRLPQDGRISIEVDNQKYDLRVSIIPVVYGEKVVIRVEDKNAYLLPKDAIGFAKDDEYIFSQMLQKPYGIILVTGPTGSGKTTTLYSAINELYQEDVNIVTVEDPVECIMDGINQIQVNPKIGLTFAQGLRSILRQDPDIIMIGEIRDTETAEIAIRSAITGHLVLSTLHTNDAPSTVVRLIDMGIEPFLVASSLIGVISQRLIRKICTNCMTQYVATPRELEQMGLDAIEEVQLSRGIGCANCGGTGYKGRIAIFEIMPITKVHREMINNGKTEDELRQYSLSRGMRTLSHSAARLVLDGVTTVSEYRHISYDKE